MQKVFDLHTDVLNKMAGLSRQPGKPCVNAASLEAGGVKAVCCACFIGDTTDRQTQLENVMRQYEVFANLNGYMGSCRIYPALEGLDYAGEELEQLLQSIHPVYATLTWNHTAGICGSCREDFPVTKWGKQVLRLLESHGVRPDLSHAGRQAFFSVFDNAEQPIVTHSCAYAVTPHIRNLTDEQIRLLISRGSVMGMNFYSDFCGGTAESLVRHILHVLELGGEDCLAFGSDFDGCARLPAGMEGPEGFPVLYDMLVKAGVGEKVLDKIFYGNACRVFAGGQSGDGGR